MSKLKVIRVYKTIHSFKDKFRQVLIAECENGIHTIISDKLIVEHNIHKGSLTAARGRYVSNGSKFDDESILSAFSVFADSFNSLSVTKSSSVQITLATSFADSLRKCRTPSHNDLSTDVKSFQNHQFI